MNKMYAFLFASILLFAGSAFSLNCPPIKTSISETICKGDVYSTTSNNYTSSGIYFDTVKTRLGCDSIIEIHLSVHEVKKQGLVKTSICEGDSIYWAGKYRKTAGDYPEKNTNEFGCDSTTLLTLSLNKRHTKDTSIQFCQGNSFSDNSYYFDKTGKHTLIYQTKNECDSIIHLDLKINPTYYKIIEVSICENTTIKLGNITVADAGTYTDSLKTSKYGCDSVIDYNVKVIISPAKPEISLKLPDSLYTEEGGSKYLWLVEKTQLNTNTQRIKAPKNGLYRVVAYMEDKCPSDTSDAFAVNTVTTNIETETITEAISIYPNPAHDRIIISGKNTLGKIQLIDFAGKIVSEYYTNQNKMELETNDLKAGKYIIKLSGANKKVQIAH